MIAAYCEGFGYQGWVFRFVSILGDRYTHGHVFDFYRQLKSNPHVLKILGNGKQRKSYLAISDCVAAIEHVTLGAGFRTAPGKTEVFNLGTDEYCEVVSSAGWICEKMGLKPEFEFSGGERGWVGDNPFIFLQTDKIRSTGWKPQFSIRQSVERTVEWLSQNEWVFEKRD
jgi:UDP-glucose 4-epimerase